MQLVHCIYTWKIKLNTINKDNILEITKCQIAHVAFKFT